MRFYEIQIDAPNAVDPSATWYWTSHPNGNGQPPDPGAQQVNLNIDAVANYTTDSDHSVMPSSDSTIEIKGVSWDQVSRSNELVNRGIIVNGGMGVGLPLATHQNNHVGTLCTGRIARTWGNWVGTEMSIGMQITIAVDNVQSGQTPSPGSSANVSGVDPNNPTAQANQLTRTGPRSIDRRFQTRVQSPNVPQISPLGGVNLGDLAGLTSGGGSVDLGGGLISSFIGGGFPGLSKPLNIIHNLLPKMPLSQAIRQTLSTVFPAAKLNINISDVLKLGYQDAGMYQSVSQYADQMYKLSRSIMGNQAFGIHMAAHNGTIHVFDDSATDGSVTLEAIDMIGQPTWVDANKLEVKCVMRGDLRPNMLATIPANTLINLSQQAGIPLAAASMQRTHLTKEDISGRIIELRHIGDFRNPDGNYWCTMIYMLVPPLAQHNFQMTGKFRN